MRLAASTSSPHQKHVRPEPGTPRGGSRRAPAAQAMVGEERRSDDGRHAVAGPPCEVRPVARNAGGDVIRAWRESAVATDALRLRYDRTRDLPCVLPLWPDELADRSPEGRRRLVMRIQRALRIERQRGIAGDWAYSLSRHMGLYRAWQHEVRAYRAARLDAGCAGRSTDDNGGFDDVRRCSDAAAIAFDRLSGRLMADDAPACARQSVEHPCE